MCTTHPPKISDNYTCYIFWHPYLLLCEQSIYWAFLNIGPHRQISVILSYRFVGCTPMMPVSCSILHPHCIWTWMASESKMGTIWFHCNGFQTWISSWSLEQCAKKISSHHYNAITYLRLWHHVQPELMTEASMQTVRLLKPGWNNILMLCFGEPI